jgi:hypothetical protein
VAENNFAANQSATTAIATRIKILIVRDIAGFCPVCSMCLNNKKKIGTVNSENIKGKPTSDKGRAIARAKVYIEIPDWFL